MKQAGIHSGAARRSEPRTGLYDEQVPVHLRRRGRRHRGPLSRRQRYLPHEPGIFGVQKRVHQVLRQLLHRRGRVFSRLLGLRVASRGPGPARDRTTVLHVGGGAGAA